MTAPALPRITHPTFELTLPSTGKKFTFRPMETRERKVMLMALEGQDAREMNQAIKGVISACVSDVKLESLTVFDIEWIFLQLVIHSIKETLDLQVSIPNREEECEECGKAKLLKVNLRDAKVVGVLKNKKDFQVEVGGSLGLRLRYPTEKSLEAFDLEAKSDVEKLMDLISLCIESVYDESTTYVFSDYMYEQRMSFLESLPVPVFDKLEKFVSLIPRLVLEVPIKCTKCGYQVTNKLEGLADFFG